MATLIQLSTNRQFQVKRLEVDETGFPTYIEAIHEDRFLKVFIQNESNKRLFLKDYRLIETNVEPF